MEAFWNSDSLAPFKMHTNKAGLSTALHKMLAKRNLFKGQEDEWVVGFVRSTLAKENTIERSML
jgi:hypothetical protein